MRELLRFPQISYLGSCDFDIFGHSIRVLCQIIRDLRKHFMRFCYIDIELRLLLEQKFDFSVPFFVTHHEDLFSPLFEVRVRSV